MKTAFTLPDVSSKYGAPMGRANTTPNDYNGEPLTLTRLPFVDDCYDEGGAYWGLPANLWAAHGETESDSVLVYVRGDSPGDAAQAVRELLPSATFTSEPGKPLDAFTRAYVEAALWSSTDDEGEPLDKRFTMADIAPDAMASIQADCAKFQYEAVIAPHFEEAGHDFWLTRNGHGAGFWDGDWADSGDKLTRISKTFGECDLYVGDDGKLHI